MFHADSAKHYEKCVEPKVAADIVDQVRDSGGDTFGNDLKFYLLLILNAGSPEDSPQPCHAQCFPTIKLNERYFHALGRSVR